MKSLKIALNLVIIFASDDWLRFYFQNNHILNYKIQSIPRCSYIVLPAVRNMK